MPTAVDTTVRCFVCVTGMPQPLFCTDSYGEVLARVNAAREAALRTSETEHDNPLALPLVNVRMVIGLPDDEEKAVVDACFNPLALVCMYRSHPDV